jgi:fido (protein-threonine AMPylation protein)
MKPLFLTHMFIVKKLIVSALITCVLACNFIEASQSYEHRVEREKKIRDIKFEIQQARRAKKNGFGFCPNLDIHNPRTQIFLGLLIVSGAIGTYKYMQSGHDQKAVLVDHFSKVVLKGASKLDPIVTVETLSFQQRLATGHSAALLCEATARSLAQQQGKKFPKYVADAPHPGEYVITTPTQPKRIAIIDRPYLVFTAQQQQEDLQDHVHYQKAIEYIESVPDLSSLSSQEFKDALRRLNSYVEGTGGVLSEFRDRPVLIMNPNIPPVYDIEGVRRHFKGSTQNLKLYEELLQTFYGQFRQSPLLQSLAFNDALEAVIGAIFRDDSPNSLKLKPFCQRFYTYNHLSPAEIEQALDELWENVKAMIQPNPVRSAAQLHLGIAEIHSFKNGNGRPGRLMTHKLLKDLGYPAFPSISENKYSTALYQSMRSRNIEPFEAYLREQICRATTSEFSNGEVLHDIATRCTDTCEEELRDVASRLGI